MAERTTRCLGCGGVVPDVDGPTHRYMLAAPGCWAAYGTLMAEGMPMRVPSPYGTLMVDAYAVQHPGVPGPQATQSVWVHLITLHLVLERGWHGGQAIRLRSMGADRSAGWTWLEPPSSMGPVTVVNVAEAAEADRGEVVRSWVEGTWAAWARHHPAVQVTAAALVAGLDGDMRRSRQTWTRS